MKGSRKPAGREWLMPVLAGCLGFFAVGLLLGYVYSTGGENLPSISSPQTTMQPSTHAKGQDNSRDSKAARQGLRFNWPEHPMTGSLCLDTCAKAKDGVCDDGRHGTRAKEAVVFCDLGTDCSDCGPWKGDVIRPWSEDHPGPISYAMAQGARVMVKPTATRPSFMMAYTDPRLDLDVSDLIHNFGFVEGGITRIFWEVLKNGCVRDDGRRGLVLDVGANFGYFTLYAAKMGCRVILWEPVPLFRAFIRYNLQLNNVSHLVVVRDAVASDSIGTVPLAVPTTGVWGTASVAGLNQHASQMPVLIDARSETLDHVVNEDALLLKVDVEGHEPQVFAGAQQMLRRHNIENIVLEYNPGVAEGGPAKFMDSKNVKGLESMLATNPRMLMGIFAAGYYIGQMHDNFAKSGDAFYDTPIFKIPEVTVQNLMYDIRDAELLAEGKLGCPVNEEMRKLNERSWFTCNMMPDDAHPKSLRSMFPYNTNLWAAKKREQIPFSGQIVGIFNLNETTKHTWFVTKVEFHGAGLRACPYLEPHMAVRSRCRCKWLTHLPENKGKWTPAELAVCAAEEAKMEELVKRGEMPFDDITVKA